MNPVIGRSLAALAAALAAGAPALAQYPNKTIRFIVPFAAGSANDTVARLIGPPLSASLGRQIVVDNRPGADSKIGMELAAASPPDGYTLVMGNIAHSIAMTLYSKPGYDLVKDFSPVTMLASGSFMLAVHPSTPAKSVQELVALAKARPNQLNVATSGAGIYLSSQLLNNMTGIKTTNVNYRSTPQAVTALVSGEVTYGFPATSAALPHVKSGRLRALAVTSEQRVSIAPDIPTISESGVKGYEANPWYAMMVPAATPKEIIARLHAESVKVLALPEVKERFGATDLEPRGSSPEQLGAYIQREINKWGKIVKATGMRPD